MATIGCRQMYVNHLEGLKLLQNSVRGQARCVRPGQVLHVACARPVSSVPMQQELEGKAAALTAREGAVEGRESALERSLACR